MDSPARIYAVSVLALPNWPPTLASCILYTVCLSGLMKIVTGYVHSAFRGCAGAAVVMTLYYGGNCMLLTGSFPLSVSYVYHLALRPLPFDSDLVGTDVRRGRAMCMFMWCATLAVREWRRRFAAAVFQHSTDSEVSKD